MKKQRFGAKLEDIVIAPHSGPIKMKKKKFKNVLNLKKKTRNFFQIPFPPPHLQSSFLKNQSQSHPQKKEKKPNRGGT